MATIISQGDNKTAYVTEFLVDTPAEVASLPGLGSCAPGSTCLVAETSELYILKNDGTWKAL